MKFLIHQADLFFIDLFIRTRIKQWIFSQHNEELYTCTEYLESFEYLHNIKSFLSNMLTLVEASAEIKNENHDWRDRCMSHSIYSTSHIDCKHSFPYYRLVNPKDPAWWASTRILSHIVDTRFSLYSPVASSEKYRSKYYPIDYTTAERILSFATRECTWRNYCPTSAVREMRLLVINMELEHGGIIMYGSKDSILHHFSSFILSLSLFLLYYINI